jgi:hypothetical protein
MKKNGKEDEELTSQQIKELREIVEILARTRTAAELASCYNNHNATLIQLETQMWEGCTKDYLIYKARRVTGLSPILDEEPDEIGWGDV